MNILLIGVGGFVGAIARYGLASFVSSRLGLVYPLGTFIVNVSGSFALGLLAGLSAEFNAVTPGVRAGIMIGFLGAFTTFSTWSVDTLNLLETGRYTHAALNVFGSVAAGLFAAWLGFAVVRIFR